MLTELYQDIIYIDPPFGGPGYKSLESIILKLNNVSLHEIISIIRLKNITKYIFIKTPLNVCLDNIIYNKYCPVYNMSDTISFNIICIKINKIDIKN